MPTCQKGHDSQASDYCDVCGTPIAGAPATSGFDGTGASRPPSASPSAGDPRPVIEADRTCPAGHSQPAGRFCEECGHDFLMVSLGGGGGDGKPATAAPGDKPATVAPGDKPATVDPGDQVTTSPSPGPVAEATGKAEYVVLAAPDRSYFESVREMGGEDVDTVTFPAYSPQRRFALRGKQMLIGRRSRSRGIEPDIDLSGQPEDPGVSHAHALLIAQPGGGWALVDVGSANGTFLNGGADPVVEHVPVPLSDGDRIHLGAWTTLTVQAVTAG